MLSGRKVKSQVETIFASAARTATTQSTGSGLAAQFDDVIFVINCTAISGAGAAVEFIYQMSLDSGTTWVDLVAIGAPVTATGVTSARITAPIGHYFRVNAVITGTTPSITFTLTADFGIRG